MVKNNMLSGKVAIVTGSGAESGIGYHIAKVLAESDAKVVLTGRRPEELNELTHRLKEEQLEVTSCPLDMKDESSIKSLMAFAIEKYGHLDILVNNAASTADPKDQDVMNLDADIWDNIFNVNARGTMLACKYAIPELLKAGGGSIINMSSGTSMAGDMQYTAYGCTKGAINTLTKYIATQYGHQGIRCNALIIGLVETGGKAQNHLPEPLLKIFEENHVIGRLGKPEDIGNFIKFLGSDESTWITGQLLNIDGGFFAQLPTTQPILNYVKQQKNQ